MNLLGLEFAPQDLRSVHDAGHTLVHKKRICVVDVKRRSP